MQHTVVLNEGDMGTFGLVSVDCSEGSLAIVHKEEVGNNHHHNHKTTKQNTITTTQTPQVPQHTPQ